MRTCELEHCEEKHKGNGYCNFHYSRSKNDVLIDKPKVDGKQKCLIGGCTNKHYNNGYCNRHWNRVRKMERKERFVQQFGGACHDCKQTFPTCAFDFDNIDSSPGHISISKLMRDNASDERIQEELKRCELVCSNCHRIRTQNLYETLKYRK